MNEAVLWLILLGTVVTTVLMMVLLNRVSRSFQGAGKEVRDELRTAREEARSAARELREEVSAGLKSTNDTLSKTLEGMGKVQQTQLEDDKAAKGTHRFQPGRIGSHPHHL